jgi:Flp pilus assembly protein TadG
MSGGKRRRAQTMVEFALVLPLFMLIIAGAIEFGRAFFAYGQLLQATQEGVRYGAVLHKTNAEVILRVQQVAPGGAADTITVSCTTSPTLTTTVVGPCVRGNVLTITAQHTENVLVPFFPVSTFTLFASASAVVE